MEKLDIDSLNALFEKGSYFDTVSAFHTKGFDAPGMRGEILSYSLSDDLFVVGVLMFSFLLICFILNKGHHVIIHQLKGFFVERSRENLFVETGSEFHYQFFLVTNCALLLGVIVYALFFKPVGTLILIPTWILLCSCIGISILAYGFKFLSYFFVNWVFFEPTKRERWMEIYSLVISLQGILFLPLACFIVYFNATAEQGLFVLLIVLLIGKMLLFYKSSSIFFPKVQGLLTNILYFCTLEMIPLLFVLKVITEINQSWIIKF